MRNILNYLIISIITLVSFTGCHDKEDKILIGVSQCSDDAWRQKMNNEILREALFYPEVDVTIKSAADNNNTQIRDIEEFIRKGVDLLIIAPNEAEAITPIVEKAYNKGIPVVLIDRKINSDKYTAYIGADNSIIGQLMGTYIANRLNGKGNIVEITGLKGSTPAADRHKDMVKVISNYPGINVVASLEASWLKKEAKEKFDSILDFHNNIDMVVAQNDAMAIGAYNAAKDRGMEKDILFVGVDALSGNQLGVDLVADGTLDATFIYPTGGDKALQIAIDILKGKQYKKENLLSSALVDRSNARIMQMQTSHINTLNEKIEFLNEKLDIYLMRYSMQRMFLFACIVILVLLGILLFFVIKAYWTKIRLNTELSKQRDQLIDLSQKLEEATKAKLAFFTNVSHDFRTPLTLIADPIRRLMESNNIKDKDRFLIETANKNVTVLLRLINQIMDFRRFENGKLDMHLSTFDLGQCLPKWAEAFRTLALRKHIHFDIEKGNGDYCITADQEMMERITYNILSNAFKFTPDYGHIKISIDNGTDANIILKITDTGVGMSAEHVSHIFESFYQVDVNHAGSGIGLALVKAFVEMHNGSISVESSEGNGTTFTIVLPVRQNGNIDENYKNINSSLSNLKEGAVLMAEQEGVYIKEKEDFAKANKEVVLVIDDNKDIRDYLRSLLEGEYSILEAANGKEGLKIAISQVPDLIICDVMMPVMDGMECCKHLKAEPRTSHIPVMMLTAYSMDEQKVKGYECGADSYISKPFSSELLLARVHNLIANHKRLKDFFVDNRIGCNSEPLEDAEIGFVEKLKCIIDENLSNADFSVEDMGEKIGFSRVQLYRKTKALTGYTPNELLRISRLNKANTIIKTMPEKNVSDIAYMVGFSSPSYFTKCYKEHFGESPTDMMRRMND